MNLINRCISKKYFFRIFNNLIYNNILFINFLLIFFITIMEPVLIFNPLLKLEIYKGKNTKVYHS